MSDYDLKNMSWEMDEKGQYVWSATNGNKCYLLDYAIELQDRLKAAGGELEKAYYEGMDMGKSSHYLREEPTNGLGPMSPDGTQTDTKDEPTKGEQPDGSIIVEGPLKFCAEEEARDD